MSRPALVVGLGGTGQWVLTWLKRDLMISNNSQMPSNVKLISIDTSNQKEANTSSGAADQKGEEPAEVGGVSLSDKEFIPIGGDARPLVEEVAEGQHHHMRWLHAHDWLKKLSGSMFKLQTGAGKIRQLGRVAVYKDMLKERVLDTALESAMESVRSDGEVLEIILAGSFAGGTGSGIFIDIALMLRRVAERNGIDARLRGFFALPSVFTSSPDQPMMARTFAAWRELNRYMVVDREFSMPTVAWDEYDENLQISLKKRLFDSCYLVDGRRNGQPLGAEPKYGVFPMIAEVVSMILDAQAGDTYTTHITTNLAEFYSADASVPMYSAIGAYTTQVPAFFIQEESSYELGQDLLLELLQPRRKPDDFGRLAATGAEKHLQNASETGNLEDMGISGRTRRRTLFQDDVVYRGEKSQPTNFMQRIVAVNDVVVDQGKRATEVQNYAKAGISPSNSVAARSSWVATYPHLGGDPDYAATQKEVNLHNGFDVRTEYRRKEGEKAGDVRVKFKKIDGDVRERFGGIISGGEDYFGQYGEALEDVHNAQIEIFRRLVRLSLNSMLMGKSDDGRIARSGKLGYAWSYMDGVVQELNTFVDFLDSVEQRRTELNPKDKLTTYANQAQDIMTEVENDKLFWIWEHPRVKRAEERFLNAQQRLVMMRREQILHQKVRETAKAFKAIAEEARDMLQQWIWHLSTGDDASSLPGLWDTVRNNKERVKANRAYDQSIGKVQRLLRDETLEVSNAELAKALDRWVWHVDYKTTDRTNPVAKQWMDISVEILPESNGGESDFLENPAFDESGEQKKNRAELNEKRLMQLSRRTFAGVVARSKLKEILQEEYPKAVDFAKHVANVSAEPLFDGTTSARPKVKSNIIRVQAEEGDDYFTGVNGLQGELRALNKVPVDQPSPKKFDIRVVGSENPYKITFVRTDDLYSFDSFTAWRECQKAFEQNIRNWRDKKVLKTEPRLIHNMSAEATAVIYEETLLQPPYSQSYRVLHPRVVMLLENERALKQFVSMHMLNRITVNEQRYFSRWELLWSDRLGSDVTFWLTPEWRYDEDNKGKQKPDIIHAAHGYILHKHTRNDTRNDVIDHDIAQIIIDSELDKLGLVAEYWMVKTYRDSADGLVQWLKNNSYDDVRTKNVVRQYYADFADVIQIILDQKIAHLRERIVRVEGISLGELEKMKPQPETETVPQVTVNVDVTTQPPVNVSPTVTTVATESDSVATNGSSELPPIMTPEQAAEAMQVDVEDILEIIESGELKARKIGKKIRIARENVVAFLSE